jgi:hypothetical protein
MPRRHTINARWTAILNDFRRSGLTQPEFCRRRGVSLPSLQYHLYKPNASKSAPDVDRSASDPNPHFVPVTIVADPIPLNVSPQTHIEMVLPNGRRIAVTPGFDSHTLRRFIAVVEERPCSD